MKDDDISGENRSDDFDPLVIESFDSAHLQQKELRNRCPVAYTSAYNGFWALMKYNDVIDVVSNPSLFITSVQNVVPKVAFTGRRPPLHLDPPEHTPYKRALAPFFSMEKMQQIAPKVRNITKELLTPFIEAGGGDICADFSRKLPGYVFSEFFNLSRELSMEIKEITEIYNLALQNNDDDQVKQTSLQLYDIAGRIISSRKSNPLDPREDPTSALLDVKVEGKPLPEEMVLGTIRQLIVVGMIAPSIFIGSMMVHLCRDQKLQDQLRKNTDQIPAAMEELLRLYTPYRGFARTANRDVEIGGRKIKEGEPIAVVFSAANRDESIFAEPDKFILNRPNIGKHVAFGRGVHQCSGAPLARVMLNIVLEELLKSTAIIELENEIKMTRWPEWGPTSVKLKLVAA